MSNPAGEWQGQGMTMNSFPNLKRTLCRCGDESRGCHSCPVAASDPKSRLWESPAPALPLQLAPGAREGKYLWLKQHESMEAGILAGSIVLPSCHATQRAAALLCLCEPLSLREGGVLSVGWGGWGCICSLCEVADFTYFYFVLISISPIKKMSMLHCIDELTSGFW